MEIFLEGSILQKNRDPLKSTNLSSKKGFVEDF